MIRLLFNVSTIQCSLSNLRRHSAIAEPVTEVYKKNTTLSAKKLMASVLYSAQINVNSFIRLYLDAEVNLYIVL